MHCIASHCIAWHDMTLHDITLHYIVLESCNKYYIVTYMTKKINRYGQKKSRTLRYISKKQPVHCWGCELTTAKARWWHHFWSHHWQWVPLLKPSGLGESVIPWITDRVWFINIPWIPEKKNYIVGFWRFNPWKKHVDAQVKSVFSLGLPKYPPRGTKRPSWAVDLHNHQLHHLVAPRSASAVEPTHVC